MSILSKLTLSSVLLLSFATPSHAFLTELVVGMTSVTNNLIDSTESVTNNSINAASTNLQSLTSNPGKMADRIGLMADRIGFMADRIVTTEGIMAGLAHKIIDRSSEPRVIHHYPSRYAAEPLQYTQPVRIQQAVGNPYMAPLPGTYASARSMQHDNAQYSASSMIYGVTGATYTASRPAKASDSAYAPAWRAAATPAPASAVRMCSSYGVTRSC
jgi:hypothetical protein